MSKEAVLRGMAGTWEKLNVIVCIITDGGVVIAGRRWELFDNGSDA